MFQGKVILVVDDESDLREILRDELIFEGATVFEAPNGTKALDLISQQKFDAVLSDIRMPGGDGATLANRIRDRDSSSPIIILITGFADLRSEEAFALGADGYVTKPFHLDELKTYLHRLLQEPQDRWSQVPLKSQKKIAVPETLETFVQQGKFKMGRGGVFLQTSPEASRVGDIVEILFKGLEPIQAVIRWIRMEPRESGQAGIGLEFLQMSAETLYQLEFLFPQWKSIKSFIPKG